MKLLALPGKNKATYQWFSNLLKHINIDAATTAIQEYDCWLTSEEELNLAVESEKAKASKPDIIMAKSIGTIVALTAFAESAKDKKFVFIGTPIHLYNAEWLNALKKLSFESDVLFIQQRFDRTASAEDLGSVLGQACTVTEVPGSDHLYNDIGALSKAINSWCG